MKSIEQTILEFSQETWGTKSLGEIALKLAEECGEVCGAAVKIPEDRATTNDLIDEVGDCLIILSQLAARHGLALEKIRDDRFAVIRFRADKSFLGVIYSTRGIVGVTEATRLMDKANPDCRYGIYEKSTFTIEHGQIIREITFDR